MSERVSGRASDTHINSITPSAWPESFEYAGPAGGGGGGVGAGGAAAGGAAAVRYGLRILHCYLPPDLGHSAGLGGENTTSTSTREDV